MPFCPHLASAVFSCLIGMTSVTLLAKGTGLLAMLSKGLEMNNHNLAID